MVPPTRTVGPKVKVIGRSRVEILNIVHFTRVLGKRTPILTIESYMLNRTTNFTCGKGTGIYNVNIHSV